MEEDVCEEYKSSLLDLTCNSKPLINMLTMLAEENVQQAPRIVRSIEEHLQKVPIEMKLPVLYLIDSIMKNVGGDYRALFTQNIVSNFCNVFEKGDERMRMQLFKLRQTWVDIFPNKKLYALDTRVKQMDPAWPIMAKEPQQTSIHVNPKFLEAKTKGQEQETLEQQAAKLASLNALNKATAEKILNAGAPSNEGEQVQRLLLQKQQEFIFLQRQKLQLELQMQQQQLRQKQEAEIRLALQTGFEQLLKSLKPPSSVATTRAPTPTPVPAGVAARPQMPRPPVPIAARDPRLQQRSMPSADISRPPPVSSASSVQPVQLGSVIVAPAQGTTTNTASCTPVTVPDQAPPDKHGNNRLSAREKHAAIKSPPRKFRIPKTSDRKKDEDNGSKNGEVEPSSPTKTSPSKSRKSAEDRDERQQRGRAGSVGKSSSSSSSSSSSQSRGGKKGRGKNGKSKSEENVRPNGDVEMMDVLPSGDVDMRVQVEKKRDSTDTTQDAPLHKRQRGHAEEGLADFDYRKPPDRPGGFTNASQRGWAQYKAKHPDEFKSPLRPARENMDVRDEDLRQMQDSAGRGAYQGRGPMQPFVDRFGRPVLRKLMTDPRFRTHVGQSGNSDMSLQQQMYEMLADPDVFLQQTDEQMRAGRLNPDLHRELKAELEKISQFRKSQPQSPIMPLNWQGGPPGPGFPPWNQPSFGGMTTGMPPLCEPAPSVGTIRVDTKMRKVQFVDDVAVVLMDGSETRQIMFKGPPKRVFIDDMEPISLPFDGTVHEFVSKRTGKKRTIKFGAPLREIFLDGVPYSAQFDNSPIAIKTADGEVHVIRLEPQPPTVDIEKRPPEHVLRALNLHPEKLADTDSDLRTLPPEVKLPATEGENSMDVDMRLPTSEGAKDVDLRKRGDMDESGTSWSSPQQAGVGWGQSRPQQPTEGGFQQSKESGGWVRYGSTSEERTAVSSNWPQQPPLGQPQQDPNIRPPWPPGPGEWNNNFGSDFMAGHGMPGVGPGRRGNQQPGFGGKEYPSYFREDFPQPPMHPHHVGVGEVRPGFLQPQFPPCRPPFTAGDPRLPPMGPPQLGGPPPPPQALLASSSLAPPPPLAPPSMAVTRPHLVGPEAAARGQPVFMVAAGQPQPMQQPMQPPLQQPMQQQMQPQMQQPLQQPMQQPLQQPMQQAMQQPPPVQQPMPQAMQQPMQQPMPQPMQPPMQPPMQQPLQQPLTQPPPLQTAVQPPPLQPPAMSQTPAMSLPSPFPAPQADGHTPQQPSSQAPTAAPVQPAALDVNVGELFSKLVAAGILKPSTGNGNAAGSQSAEQYQSMGGHLQKKKRRRPRGEHTRQEPKKPIEGIPLLSFSRTDQLKIKHPSVINALHVGTQCASCGLRFTDEKCEKYRQHLDWHFRANRRDKDGARKAFSRKWFYEVEDWIQFEEIEDLEERARSFFEQQATVEPDQSSNSPTAVKSVPASGDETGNTCAVCEEAFQLFWAEEEEQWHFRDAIRIENKVYHPACYEDFKRAAEAPSPVKMEAEEAAPQEEDKAMDVDSSVKEEVASEATTDEKPIDQSGSDEKPPEQMAVDETAAVAEEGSEGNEATCDKGGSEIKDDNASGDMQDDPVVVVDNLGEFGVSLSDAEQNNDEEERPPETVEPKVVVKSTGGIVMKVKAESIQPPISPVSQSTTADAPDAAEGSGSNEPAAPVPDESASDEEFRPPTPDPRFQSLPPVQRGNELSGLCCIM